MVLGSHGGLDEVQAVMAMSMERAVEQWFCTRGFTRLSLDELPFLPEKPDMAFSGDGTAFVILVEKKALSNRGYFMEVIARASSLRPLANYLYLAVPRELAPFVDTEVLRKRGIGLLVVGEEGAREVLASPFRHVERPSAAPAGLTPEAEALLNDLLARLSALEQRVARLEGEIARARPALAELSELASLRDQVRSLSARLDMLTRRVNALAAAGPPAQAPAPMPAAPPAPTGPSGPDLEGLPSFFKDNPWLEILARRGQEESR